MENIRKQNIIFLFCILGCIIATSCSNDENEEPDENNENVLIGKWNEMSTLDGLSRSDASSFTIGNKGYLYGGYNGKTTRLSDLWEYDMDMDYWTQKADLPGVARNSAVSFAIDSKGYIGTGYDGSDYLNDFWEYDPSTNAWTQKADFPGSPRYEAVAFSVAGKGYIGCGYDDNYLKDFYVFDPSSNSWEQNVYIDGSKRRAATSFVINNEVYVCCGINNGNYVYEFWKYNPETTIWTRLKDISATTDYDYSIPRSGGVAFVIDGVAYLACGENKGSISTDTWKYDPEADLWERVADFEGVARTRTVSFSNGKRGFIATGSNSNYYYDDIWEFVPH